MSSSKHPQRLYPHPWARPSFGPETLDVEALPRASFSRTWALLESAVENPVRGGRVTPGAALGVWSRKSPRKAWIAHAGARRLEPSPQALEPDTPFDLASLTKVVGTATLLARLVERGWVRWDDPVEAFLPSFAPRGITLGHLASHTAGYAAWEPLWQVLLENLAAGNAARLQARSISERQRVMRSLVMAARPEKAPGERALYSDLSFLMLGFCLEEATGLPLDRAFARWVFEPWGLQSFEVRRVEGARTLRDERVAATEKCSWRGRVLQGEVHDDNCWAMGGYGGHAGLFGSVVDLLRFGTLWLGGAVDPQVRARAWSRVAEPQGCERTWGWDTPSGDLPAAGRLLAPGTVGHLGFTGTSLWIDPAQGLVISLLTNRVHPTRENIAIRAFRPALHEQLVTELREFL